MKPELSILKSFLKHDNYKEYSDAIQASDLPDELQLVYRCLENHHKEHTEDLAVQDLANLFFTNKVKDKEYYQALFENLEKYTPVQSTVVALINSIRRSRFLRELSLLAYEVNEGKKPPEKLDELLAGFSSQDNDNKEDDDFVTDDLETLIKRSYAEGGLPWRLDSLNERLGPLRKGNFGFIFARPETGKTTFLCSEITHMLNHTDKNILWFNNEEAGDVVKLRIYQSYFGVTLEQLYGNIQHYSKLFNEQSGGRLKLKDAAQIDWRTVEKLSSKHQPGLIIFDQIDKLQGFQADREDLLLGRIYRWSRELAKEHCPVIGATQADGTGEGVRWLTMANVANAKTSKQAEADFILGIGAIHDPGWEKIRFLNISKNKLLGSGKTNQNQRHGRFECLIDANVARYRDLDKTQ